MDDLQLIQRESTSMLDKVKGLTVLCDEDYKVAGELIMAGKAMIKKITDYHQADINRWHEGHTAAIAKRDEDLDQVKKAVEIAAAKAGDYKFEQDRLAREEKARIDAERRRQEEEKRLAEAMRLEAEAKARREEEERQRAEAARLATEGRAKQAEEARRLAEEARIAAELKTKESQATLDAPIPTPRPTRFESPVPKVAGLSMRGKWKGKIVDPKAVKREFCDPTQWRIDARIEEYTKYVKDPTEEQKAQVCADIGGVEMEFVSSSVGRLK